MAATDNASPVCSCLDHQCRNCGRYLYGKGYCYKDVSSLANSRHRSTAFSDATMMFSVVDTGGCIYMASFSTTSSHQPAAMSLQLLRLHLQGESRENISHLSTPLPE
ncbi:predicted protein [Lichtheimia corymbifera JMRC:FSU:9682]|uniref:Uncharacterized protein n=1 Tax=Lichtheimia corymbifera JMRC:FSU:9682 TaxID=1263082 RepID=A0A068SFZ9_9FUNG|nr:predicted protein [Lichtheimia corymbifera JMRC:FSU:9682]